METLRGYVEKITYRNEENGYTVLTLSVSGTEECLVGAMPPLTEGEFVEADGEHTFHPSYGLQFAVSALRFIPPLDAESAERYLASGAVKGVGEKMAHRIVEKFGDDTFRILEERGIRTVTIVTSHYHQRWGQAVFNAVFSQFRRTGGYEVDIVLNYCCKVAVPAAYEHDDRFAVSQILDLFH